MQYFFFFMLMFIGLSLIARLLTVLIHELGHAIPAILLTGQKVAVYIGSYGDTPKSVKFSIGLLTINLCYNPITWSIGLCAPSAKTKTINKQIIYTLTGPLASFVIASIACYFTFTYDLHGFLKLFLVVFLGSAVIDLFVNLIPSQRPIKLNNGQVIHNDGYSIKKLLYYKRLPKEYSEGVDLFNERRYSEAGVLLENVLIDTKDENIYRLAISSYLQDKNYAKAKDLSIAFALTGKMNSDDLANHGLSCSLLGLHEEAVELYDRSLQQNPDNRYSLNNKGYTLNLMGQFEEAIPLFNKAIELDKDFAYSYNNRGLSKIKLGQAEEGLQDINRSFELNPDNSYAYMNLGIYHFDKGEHEEALRLFVKAKELDRTTYMIDELINDAKHQIDQGTAVYHYTPR